MNTIGIIGFGTLGAALADGLHRVRSELGIYATRASAGAMRPFATRCASNAELVDNASVIILCVKPQQARAVLEQIAPRLQEHHLVVSACAGVTLEELHAALPRTANIARVMPNLACEINQGATALCFSQKWQRNCKDDVIALFELLGAVVLLEERHFDAVTAVSGCGPAYACIVIEALTDAGVKQGLPRAAARTLVVQTLLGSALMVLNSDKHPAEIRDRVATPGGCTIDAITCLEDGKLRHTLIAAVTTATAKSRTLSSQAMAPNQRNREL